VREVEGKNRKWMIRRGKRRIGGKRVSLIYM